MEIAAQFQHDGESGLHVPFGTRMIFDGAVSRILPMDTCTADEGDLIRKAEAAIAAKVAGWNALAGAR